MKPSIYLLFLALFFAAKTSSAQKYSQEDLKQIAADFMKQNGFTADTSEVPHKYIYHGMHEVKKKRHELMAERYNMVQPYPFAIKSKGNKWQVAFEYSDYYKQKHNITGKVGKIVIMTGQARVEEVLVGDFEFE